MPSIAICYASRYGQTERIAKRLADKLATDAQVELVNLVNEVQLPKADYYVVGAPVIYGNAWQPFRKWLQKHDAQLRDRLIAAFNVNLTARKANKRAKEDNPYLEKMLALLPGSVPHTQVFAGALDYPQYPWYDRVMIRFIMHLTGGPKRSAHRIDYTYWPDVDQFAMQIAADIAKP